jgi:hypothetical protein
MIDFQIVNAQTLLPVQSVAPIRGFLPFSVVILGTNLDRTTQVLFNNVEAPSFIVMSKTRLIAQIPVSQVGQPFKSIQVLGDSLLSTSGSALLSLLLTNPPREVSGLSRLVQSWVMIFLTTPGSDVFNPQSGGGGAAIIGRTTDASGSGVAADLANAITNTKNELLRVQSQYPGIPLTEKLLSSNLEAVSFDQSSGTLVANVSLQNMLAQSAQVSLSSSTISTPTSSS